MLFTFATGRVVDNAIVRTTPTGKVGAFFRFAARRPYKDKDGKNAVEYIRVAVWGPTMSKVAEQYAVKGKELVLRGEHSLNPHIYTTKDGRQAADAGYLLNINTSDGFELGASARASFEGVEETPDETFADQVFNTELSGPIATEPANAHVAQTASAPVAPKATAPKKSATPKAHVTPATPATPAMQTDNAPAMTPELFAQFQQFMQMQAAANAQQVSQCVDPTACDDDMPFDM